MFNNDVTSWTSFKRKVYSVYNFLISITHKDHDYGFQLFTNCCVVDGLSKDF